MSEGLSRTVQRDQDVRLELRQMGLSVAVLWECQIRVDLNQVVESLRAHIRKTELLNETWTYVS
jgi:G:T-mismatch repair DNA endonuclease (very short patch repair protein)